MSAAVEGLLEAFDRLPEDERRVAVIEILKRVGQFDYPPLSDAALAQVADQSFQEYDAHEAAN
jgi:hypothetical protein